MTSLKTTLCGLALSALIAAPVLANEPTAPAGTDANATAAEHEQHPGAEAKAPTKTAKKSKKTKKEKAVGLGTYS